MRVRRDGANGSALPTAVRISSTLIISDAIYRTPTPPSSPYHTNTSLAAAPFAPQEKPCRNGSPRRSAALCLRMWTTGEGSSCCRTSTFRRPLKRCARRRTGSTSSSRVPILRKSKVRRYDIAFDFSLLLAGEWVGDGLLLLLSFVCRFFFDRPFSLYILGVCFFYYADAVWSYGMICVCFFFWFPGSCFFFFVVHHFSNLFLTFLYFVVDIYGVYIMIR